MQLPTFTHEKAYWQQGLSHIAGVDEAGMGALAGPVVAAAVIFPKLLSPYKRREAGGEVIRDSKTLSEAQRLKAEAYIKNNALAFAIGEASVSEIDELNIRQASHLAMIRAITALNPKPNHIIIDGNPVNLNLKIRTTNILKGDQHSYTIAAASILAKTYRDALMKNLDKKHPEYGFASHKGYGSKVHLDSLNQYGPCPHHRQSYAPVKASYLQKQASRA